MRQGVTRRRREGYPRKQKDAVGVVAGIPSTPSRTSCGTTEPSGPARPLPTSRRSKPSDLAPAAPWAADGEKTSHDHGALRTART